MESGIWNIIKKSPNSNFQLPDSNSMFEKLKQLKDLRDQAKTMQSVLAEEKITVNDHGINLTMNGNMEVIALTIDDDVVREKIAGHVKDAINEATKKTQRVMAQKMQDMGGLGELSNLLKK